MEQWNDGTMEATISPRCYFKGMKQLVILIGCRLATYSFASAYRYRYPSQGTGWGNVVTHRQMDTDTWTQTLGHRQSLIDINTKCAVLGLYGK